MSSEVWDEIIWRFPKSNGCSVEHQECKSNFIPHLIDKIDVNISFSDPTATSIVYHSGIYYTRRMSTSCAHEDNEIIRIDNVSPRLCKGMDHFKLSYAVAEYKQRFCPWSLTLISKNTRRMNDALFKTYSTCMCIHACTILHALFYSVLFSYG